MKSMFATSDDLVRNLANLSKVATGGHEDLVALNRLIDEARALLDWVPQPEVHESKAVQWVVSVKGVARLTSEIHVTETSEVGAQEAAIEIARGMPIEDFEMDGPEGLTVSSIERLP